MVQCMGSQFRGGGKTEIELEEIASLEYLPRLPYEVGIHFLSLMM